jgi:hypothetical protein
MTKFFKTALISLISLFLTYASASAGSAVAVYVSTNCYIFEASDGFVLFERSGGEGVKLSETVIGTMDDFGYQELKDAKGKDALLGFVQNFGVTDEEEIASFKSTCR